MICSLFLFGVIGGYCEASILAMNRKSVCRRQCACPSLSVIRAIGKGANINMIILACTFESSRNSRFYIMNEISTCNFFYDNIKGVIFFAVVGNIKFNGLFAGGNRNKPLGR